MLPRSFRTLGYDSTLICGELTLVPPFGIRIVQTGIVIDGPPGRGLWRALIEPFFALHEIGQQRPQVVIISPMKASLFSFLPLVYLYRRISPGQTGKRLGSY